MQYPAWVEEVQGAKQYASQIKCKHASSSKVNQTSSNSQILTTSINRYFSDITLTKHAIAIVILKFSKP